MGCLDLVGAKITNVNGTTFCLSGDNMHRDMVKIRAKDLDSLGKWLQKFAEAGVVVPFAVRGGAVVEGAPEISRAAGWTCNRCTFDNLAETTHCAACGSSLREHGLPFDASTIIPPTYIPEPGYDPSSPGSPQSSSSSSSSFAATEEEIAQQVAIMQAIEEQNRANGVVPNREEEEVAGGEEEVGPQPPQPFVEDGEALTAAVVVPQVIIDSNNAVPRRPEEEDMVEMVDIAETEELEEEGGIDFPMSGGATAGATAGSAGTPAEGGANGAAAAAADAREEPRREDGNADAVPVVAC